MSFYEWLIAVNTLILDISWVCGNGEDLPFEDNSFDVYTIAFGIRNFTNVEKVHINCQLISLSVVANVLFPWFIWCAYFKALDEAYRVLAPGGRFMCLEFSVVTNPILERY